MLHQTNHRQVLDIERNGTKLWIATFVAATLALLVCLGVSLPANAQAGADIAGTWKGELGEGAMKLHLVLTITKAQSGDYSAQVNSVEQGAVLPTDGFTSKEDAVRFEIKAV